MLLYIVVASVGIAVALLVFVLSLSLTSESRVVRQRLAEIGIGVDTAPERRGRAIRRQRVEALVRSVGKRVIERTQDIGRTRQRLLEAGYRDPQSVPVFQGIRLLLPIGFTIGSLVLVPFMGLPGIAAALAALWGLALGWSLPGFIIGQRAGRRKKEIENALADVLDLLVVCVEAGLGLNQALLRVATEIGHLSPVLADELGHTNLQIRAGTPRYTALRDLGKRTGVPDVEALVTMMIQTERFGTSIAQSLRVHADTLREKRRQRAEERAAKTAVKMIFPLAFCIFPALFVVILGPAFIQIFQMLGDLM